MDKLEGIAIALKLTVYAVGAAFGTWRVVHDLATTHAEAAPTVLQMDRFADGYRGQQWLDITGRLAVGEHVVRPSGSKVHQGKSLVYIYVPLVEPDWQPRDPVRMVAVLGPVPAAQAEQVVRGRASQPSVNGVLAPAGAFDAKRLFPSLNLADPVRFLNEGTAPIDRETGYFLLVVFGGMACFCTVRGLQELRELRRDRTEEVASAPKDAR
jgi:hypothetical protein